MHVVVAMSGGVDSSVAAARLLELGHDVSTLEHVFLNRTRGVAKAPGVAAGAADASQEVDS